VGGVLEFVKDEQWGSAVFEVFNDAFYVSWFAVGWFDSQLPGKGLEHAGFVEGGMWHVDALVGVGVKLLADVVQEAGFTAAGTAVDDGEAATIYEVQEAV